MQAPAAPLPPPPDLADPPALAQAGDWWAALRCAVLLAALNPGTLAGALAAEAPAAGAALEMLATGSRTYPPGLGYEDLSPADAAAAAAEQTMADAAAAAEVRAVGYYGAKVWRTSP